VTTARKVILLAVILLAWNCSAVSATDRVKLYTSFTPDRIEASTTIKFSFQVYSAVAGRVPVPVTNVDLHLPAGMGLGASTLGLANCDPAGLLLLGPMGCPSASRIGFGKAVALVQLPPAEGEIEGEVTEETATITTLIGPPSTNNLEVLFYAEGKTPVEAQLVFPGQILADQSPFGGRLNTTIPLIPAWSEGPDISVVRMSSTIGPLGLIYYRRRHGRFVPYHPKGILVPRDCPHGGYLFRADFTFLDGTRASANTPVPCPSRGRG
jgi:hypothetical protein